MDFKKLNLIIFLLLNFCVSLYSGILTIYSDEGISGTSLDTWSAGNTGQFVTVSSTVLVSPEGSSCLKTVSNPWWNPGGWWENWAGWGVCYNSEQNFSQYNGGQLRFWIYSSTKNIKVEIQRWNNETLTKWIYDYGFNDSDVNQWKLIKIPLNDYALDITTSVKYPFMITADLGNDNTTSATFYVDLVRWVTSDVSSPYFNVKIKDIETHVEESSITFNVDLQQVSSWTVANEYIELEFDPDNTSWGIQIYTDNKASDANPIYTGTGNPCGLVDTTTTTKVLPMGWTIESSTKTKGQLGNGEPDSWVTDGFMWKWMKDKNTQGFQNGEDYITLWDNRGVLYDGSQRAWKNSPNYIYLSADFSTAVGGRKYKTNQLKIEFYYK